MKIGTSTNHDGNANEPVTSKYKFTLLALLRDYSNSFNLYNVADYPVIEQVGTALKLRQNDFIPSCDHVLHETLNLVILRY